MAEAARRRDVIDVRPAFTQADADALNARFAGACLIYTPLKSLKKENKKVSYLFQHL